LAAKVGYETIMINCNQKQFLLILIQPINCTEPVFGNISMILSTRETRRDGVQLGGQTALKLAEKLSKYGIKLSD
jgi:carbamoyl-phosphate synthase large subunit